MKDSLRQRTPLQALQTYLTDLERTDASSPDAGLSCEDAASLSACARQTAVASFNDQQVHG